MNSKPLWIGIIVILIALGAWYALAGSKKSDMNENAPAAANDAAVTPAAETGGTPSEASGGTAAAAAKTVTVSYTDNGFSPTTVSVNKGDTVKFVNNSSAEMWVASDEHPTHTEYDGTATSQHCAGGTNSNGSFDECARAAAGASWSYTFTKSGSFDYHNHARASHGGVITVI